MTFYKALLLSALVLFPAIVKAETGYYVMAKYRYFGPNIDAPWRYDGIEDVNTSAKRFYPSMSRNSFSYLKNSVSTFKDAFSYGDWDKEKRVMIAYEFDDKKSSTSGGTYGYHSNASSVYYLTDWGFAQNYWRLGVGGSVGYYDTKYDNDLKQTQKNAMSMVYAIYNDAPNQIRLRSRAFLGYGQTDAKLLSDDGAGVYSRESDVDNYFYGFENALSKTYGDDFYLQPSVEFNGYGLKQGKIKDNYIEAKSKSYFILDSLVGLYAGVRGTDFLGNSYNFKLGGDWTYIFDSPYDAYLLEDIYIKCGNGRRQFWAWKAYLNYDLPSGWGFYGDFRYYAKEYDNISFAFAVGYKF